MFTGDKILIVWVVKITLPDYTLRLCDGGFVDFNAERYYSYDGIFGTIESVDKGPEGGNDSAPGLVMTFLPKSTGAAGALSAPGMQNSPFEVWQLEVSQSTNAVTGSQLEFLGKLDFTKLTGGLRDRRLEMGVIADAEWLFMRDEANTLSARFHQEHWPGELGLSNITGANKTVAWGVAAPARTSTTGDAQSAVNQAVQRVFS